ncbi:MAG: hypothetical protein R3300_02775 [Candidatus Promineifilaceae bacterium]|nr:hypothetical protein [Candidatus Promineifilaceae bacterium]
MLIAGLNDNESELRAIAASLERMQPDWIHLALPLRPPAETWVTLPDETAIQCARQMLGEGVSVLWPEGGAPDLSGHADVTDAVLDIIVRHPVSQDDLLRALAALAPEEVEAALQKLRASGQAQLVKRHGTLFWRAGPAACPTPSRSQAVSPERLRRRLRYHRLPENPQL